MTTRREFFKSLFRSVAVAAALAYAPSLLKTPETVLCRGEWIPVREWLARLDALSPQWPWTWKAIREHWNRGDLDHPTKVHVTYPRGVEVTMQYSEAAR